MDSIKYDITATSSPMMPKLGRGTECIRLLISQISPDMREVIVPMLFPALGAYISETEFMYPDNTWKKHRANNQFMFSFIINCPLVAITLKGGISQTG